MKTVAPGQQSCLLFSPPYQGKGEKIEPCRGQEQQLKKTIK